MVVSFLVAATTAASKTGLSLTDIAALITAVGGVIVGIYAARRSSRNDKATARQTEESNLLAGYGQIVKDLQEEIARIRTQYTEDLARWQQERKDYEDKIRFLEPPQIERRSRKRPGQ